MKLLATIDICGLPYKIMSVPREHRALIEASGDPELGADACCSFSTGVLYIAADLNPARVKDAIMHEVLHAILEGAGGDYALRSLIRDDDVTDDLLERLIRSMTPWLLVSLRQLRGVLP